jgi:hypothetical protein
MHLTRRSLIVALTAALAAPIAIASAPATYAAPPIQEGAIVPDGAAVVVNGPIDTEVRLKFEVSATTLAYANNFVIGTQNGPGQALIQLIGPNGQQLPSFGPVYNAGTETQLLTPGTWFIRLLPYAPGLGVQSQVQLFFYQHIKTTTTIGQEKSFEMEQGQAVEMSFKVTAQQKVDFKVIAAEGNLVDGMVGLNLYNAVTGASQPYTVVSGPLTSSSPSIVATLPPGRYVASARYFGPRGKLTLGVLPTI